MQGEVSQSIRLRKNVLPTLFSCVLIPIAVVSGTFAGLESYYLTSVAVIVLTLIPFLVSFERRKPSARELVVLGVLIALAVVGRALFAFVPGFTPVVGLVVIAGIALGPSSGFMVGALGMFLSDFMFGQGPWTPWQMLAMGLAGWLFGILFSRSSSRRGNMDKRRLALLGAGAAVFDVAVVGVLLDTCALFTMTSVPTDIEAIAAVYLSGLPVNFARAAATFLTLFFGANPILEQLGRVRMKYGLMD